MSSYKTKLSNWKYSDSLEDIYIAYEPIIAYSTVFLCEDNGIYKVYVNQSASFDNGISWLVGVAQNDAKPGEEVGIIIKGLSKVRVYSRSIPTNKNLYLMAYNGNALSNGCTCQKDETNIDRYTSDNKYLYVGHVPASTQRKIGSTLNPTYKIVEAWIGIVSTVD